MITIRTIMMKFPDQGESLLVVAWDPEEHIVGTVKLKVFAPKVGPKAAIFCELFVATASRRSGVGRSLLDVCEEIAVRECCDFICAYVKPGNDAAQAFYKALGYGFGYAWDDGDIAITKQLYPARNTQLTTKGGN